MAYYTSKIKDIRDSLASVDVNVEEDEMVQICLRGLASKFGAVRTTMCMRENTPSFFDLQSMLLVEDNHAGGSTSRHTDNKMLYTARRKIVLGNMSLRMEPDGTGCKTQRTGSSQNRPRSVQNRSEGQRCKYAEKSYMYKYDLGHRFYTVVVIVIVLLRSSCTEREREREVVASSL